MDGRDKAKSWFGVAAPLAVAVIGLVELAPWLRKGVFGTPQFAAMIIIGLCFGFAWGAARARRRG